MTRRTLGIILTAVTALAVGSHTPKPCELLDALCRFDQAAHLRIHQIGRTVPPIDSNQKVIWTVTGERKAT